MFNYRLSYYVGKSGKYIEGREERYEHVIQPSYFGYYYWYWIPKFHSNKGVFGKDNCIDWSFYWLNRHIDFTWWRLR